ncbi:S1C family serine protease, partial [Tenacibaculum piscium]
KKIVDDLLEFGTVQEAIIGISIDNSIKDIEGVLIGEIEKNSQAVASGLRKGDVITKVNNVEIITFSDLKGQLTAKRPGEYVNLTVHRNGKILIKKVQLTKKNTFTSRSFGVKLKNVTSEEKEKYHIKGGAKIIATNNKGFQYYNVGANYILTKINGKQIISASEAVAILDTYTGNEQMYLELLSPSGKIERYRF